MYRWARTLLCRSLVVLAVISVFSLWMVRPVSQVSLRGALLPALNTEMLQSVKDCPFSLPSDQVAVDISDVMRSKVMLNQDHPAVIQMIRTHYLQPPSSEPYVLTVGDDLSQGQSTAIREVLGDLRDGFFIECGALDGETRSNSLAFEKKLGWKGLLVEGDPKNYEMVVQKHRKAWTTNACLSTKPYPHSVMFEQRFNLGKINSDDIDVSTHRAGLVEVQCLPFYSLYLALNITTVHYFSLDVESSQLEVLETIPWDKVDIKTLSVEFTHLQRGDAVLQKYMEDKGYWVHKGLKKTVGLVNDWIFVKSSYKSPSDVYRADQI